MNRREFLLDMLSLTAAYGLPALPAAARDEFSWNVVTNTVTIPHSGFYSVNQHGIEALQWLDAMTLDEAIGAVMSPEFNAAGRRVVATFYRRNEVVALQEPTEC